MSDDAYFPYRPALMSAPRARDLSRIYKGLALQLRAEGFPAEAAQAERDSMWWMTYAVALSQTKPDDA